MKFAKNIWIRIIPVFVLVAVTIMLSMVVYAQVMETEEESCWERLEIATSSTSGKIQVRLNDNINFLKAVSDSYILSHNIENTEEVGKYLNSVMDMTIFSRIDVILPDNSLITQTGEIVERGGNLSYDDLVSRGTHISGRTTSSFTGKEVICCVIPIEEDGKVLGLLVGTIECETLCELFEVATYKEDAQIFLIDCTDGNYIIDNWHDELGNIYDIGERKSVDGYETIDMVSAIIAREEARMVFVSETNSKKTYQCCAPVEGYNWELCVAVQEDVVFAHAYKLKDILFTVVIVEGILLFIYIAWNMWLTMVAAKSEEKARILEFDRVKNEARTKFISNMSHDIRTPLNGIVGMLQIIDNHREDKDKVDDCLKKIKVSTQYLSTLASDMLDINEIENDKLIIQTESLNLKQLADELNVMLEQKASEVDVECYMDYSQLEYPCVMGSNIHIKRILINLVGNAIKYSKDAGKKVWVTICDEEMHFDKGKRMYKFIIKDNGIGMTEAFQENMYNAFEQETVSARSSYQGYGLGLTIVNYLVKKMDGEIELESKKGVGSTFTVSIPMTVDLAEDRVMEDIVVELNGLRILVVEDNEFNMEIAEVLLTDAGAIVDGATDGKMALEMFASSKPNTYDVILMDIMMPVMDGCEAAKAIREMNRTDAGEIPIIAMTANAFSEEIKRCMDVGMNAHVAKPLDINKLMIEIAKYSKRTVKMRRENNGTV